MTDLVKENRLLNLRLQLSQAFFGLLEQGFDALLHHGVNYRLLPSYSDKAVLDEANRVGLEEGRTLVLTWIERVRNDIAAAVRRKGFKKV